MPTPANRARLAWWTLLVLAIAAMNYWARFASSSSATTSRSSRDAVYSWSAFAGGLVIYAVWLALVLGIAGGHRDLLALRRPRSWWRALLWCAAAIVTVYVVSGIVAVLPLPQSPSNEQGLTPTHWEPRHAAAFAANVALFSLVAPLVEELMFRGVGQSLLRFLGRVPTIGLVGIAFGASHGLVEALLVLVPFGMALAYVRERTGSVYPGMLVHGLFNGLALALSVA